MRSMIYENPEAGRLALGYSSLADGLSKARPTRGHRLQAHVDRRVAIKLTSLLKLSASRDWPDCFQPIPSEAVKVVVQRSSEVGIANDQFNFVADF